VVGTGKEKATLMVKGKSDHLERALSSVHGWKHREGGKVGHFGLPLWGRTFYPRGGVRVAKKGDNGRTKVR